MNRVNGRRQALTLLDMIERLLVFSERGAAELDAVRQRSEKSARHCLAVPLCPAK